MMNMAKSIRPEKVAIYIRWSTEDQGDGTTLVVQQEGCQHYVLSQGWQVTPSLIFVDDGCSGGTLDRPKMTALRKAVKAGDVDCVVVYKLDRLSRSVMDTVNLVLGEWEGRTYLKSAREPVDTTTPMGKQFFYMLVSYAEWERNVIKERTFSGKLRRAQEGKNPGIPAAYGYRHSDQVGMLEIDPEKAEFVRFIFNKYLTECGAYKITVELNRSGVPSPTGLMWYKSTILEMLKNPIYAGRLVYGRTTTNPRRQRDKSEPTYLKNSSPVMADAQFPAIIDPDLFDRVQALMKTRHRGATGVRSLSSEHLLTGILKCRCGAAMNSHTTTKRDKQYEYYQCLGRAEKGPHACKCGMIPQHVLDDAVTSKLEQLLASEESRQSFVGARQQWLSEAMAGVQVRRQQAATTLEALEGQMRRLNRDYRAGALSASSYEENRREIEEERNELGEQVAGLEGEERALSQQLREHEALKGVLDLAERWAELDMLGRKSLLRKLLTRVVAYKSPEGDVDVEVVWKFSEPSPRPAQ